MKALTLCIILIGTGGPELTPTCAGEATLVVANTQKLLFDAGRGALEGISAARIPPQDVTRIFLTHLHNDHVEGLPSLWITPWFLLGRRQKLQIWGPPGSAAMVQGMRQMYAHDVEHRPNAAFKKEHLDIEIHGVLPRVVYSEAGVRVAAVPVEHSDGNPALGYRIDAFGRAILLTGDATYGDGPADAGRGVDVLISNVAAGTEALERSGAIEPVLAKLMHPEQAAGLFLAGAPRLAVYSHIVKKGLPGAAGDEALLARTRKAGYAGPLRMGSDGMKITVGEKIEIAPAPPRESSPDMDGPGALF